MPPRRGVVEVRLDSAAEEEAVQAIEDAEAEQDDAEERGRVLRRIFSGKWGVPRPGEEDETPTLH